MKIMAAMSLPRLCFTDNVFTAFRVFAPMNIPVNRGGTVYWEMGLSCALEEGIKDGFEFAFTLDYDSIFLKCHVEEMIDIVRENDDIDCLVPLQMRRAHVNEVLFWDSQDQVPPGPLDKRVSVIEMGHFGLTLFRLKALDEVPRPWLVSEPGKDGKWGDDRVDADIGFWAKWREAGKKVHLANNVRIGHMQLVMTWPSTDLRAYDINIEQFNMMEEAS
jgi:hypothetical protein